MPEWLYRPLFHQKPIELLVTSGVEPTKGAISPEDLARPDLLGSALEGARNRAVDVRFDRSVLLSRAVEIPSKAAGDADAILELEITRAAPFGQTDVVWSATKWIRDGGWLKAEQYLLKSKIIDRVETSLQALGCELISAAPDVPFVRKPFLDGSGRGGGATRFWMWATVIVWLVVASVLGASLWREATLQAEEVERLEAIATDLRDQAVALRRQADAGLVEQDDAVVLEQLALTRGRLNILAELTELLPDTVWVNELSIREGTVVLSGFASGSSADLVREIELQEWARGTRLTSPVSRSGANGRERFQLQFELLAPQP